MSLLLDKREGSWQLARLEPLRSLLPTCPVCKGQPVADCPGCRQFDKSIYNRETGTWGKYVAVGRQLSHITTSRGEGGPDVLICGNGPDGPILIAVEVKSVRDLIASADTGRLQADNGQLQAMLADYQQSWLLWYGAIRCGDDGNLEEPGGRGENGRCLWKPFTKNASPTGRPLSCEFLDAMLFAVASMGVHVAHVGTERQAARWLASLYRYWSKPYAEHKFTHTFKDVSRFPKAIPGVTAEQRDRAAVVVDRYPGLGYQRALAAAKHFPSVQAMANADEKEWVKVPGIGKVIAASVVKRFNS